MDNQQNDIQAILQAVRSLEKNTATKNELQEILEVVEFIKNNAITKNDFLSGMGRLETRVDRVEASINTRLDEKTSETVNHVDAFAVLHQKLEQELTALRGKYDRLEAAMLKIAQRLELNVTELGL